MTTRLLRVIEAAGQRDCREVTDRARAEAESILTRAREEAERILAARVPPRPVPPADPRLRDAGAGFLRRYGQALEDLRSAVLQELEKVPSAELHRALAAVLREVLEDLDPGIYRLACPDAFWERIQSLEGFPSGRGLRRSRERGESFTLRSEDGRLTIRFSPTTLLARYLEADAHEVARLLLGDELD